MKILRNYFVLLFIFFIVLFSTSTTKLHAEIPQYKSPELLARANIVDGYNLPAMTFLSNTSPVINNQGDVAFKLMSIAGENHQGLWIKNAHNLDGAIVYTAPDSRLITEPSLNEEGLMAFNLFDEGITDGVFTFDSSTNQVSQVLDPENKNISFYTYPQVTTSGHIFFRGTSEDNIRTFYQFDKNLSSIIKEGDFSFGEKTSYLFKPSINDSGELSFKRRIGDTGNWDESQGDEILLLKPNGKKYDYLSVARDRDLDSKSPFSAFYNTTGLSKNGLVVFSATLADSSKKALMLWQNNTLTTLAEEGTSDLSEIESFAPKVNNKGLVLFRGKDTSGLRSLYVASLEGVQKIISEGTEVMTDQGPGKILSNPNYPGFGGEVDMNDKGEIVFFCLIVRAKNNNENKELGSAVYKMSPDQRVISE